MITSIPRLTLETETLPNGELELIKLRGREAISQLFEYDLLAVCRDPSAFEPEEIVGEEACLVFAREDEEVRRVYGMISTISDRLETETEHTTYRLTFVPRAYRLTLVETLDVFLDINVPDVIRQKMKDAGFQEKAPGADPGSGSANKRLGQAAASHDFELRLYEKYPLRDFIVQYKETDLAFISRLCEHLGISLTVEHASGKDVLVFTDVNEGFRAVEGNERVPFRGRGEHRDVYAFEETIRMIPAQYVVRDYNYRTPQVTLTGNAQVPTGLGSVVEYGSHVKTPEEAEKMAQVRAQERMASRRVYKGVADVPRLRAGARFTLEGHPRGDTKLLITETVIEAEQVTLGYAAVREGFFRVELTAISEKRRFRPARLTPKPRIHGVVTGVIDSPKDDTRYADVDDQGRYKVRFLFDTTSPEKGQASKLVRMAQPHAGEGYGMHFPLRAGVEVMITFVDGDPDRPIIVSTVPNPQTASPVQAGNAPRNIIRTGGGNEINIDDTHEGTRIKMTVPHSSTTFQLGKHNSPEDGAILDTQGASSTVAIAGVAGFTSFASSISVLTKFFSSGSILTKAELPKFVEIVGGISELMQALIETASAAVEAATAAREAHVAQLKVDSIKAQVAAQKQKAATEAAQNAASSNPLALALNGIDDYRAAQAKLAAAYGVGTPAYNAAMAELLKKPGMAAAQQAITANGPTLALHDSTKASIDALHTRYPAGTTFPANESTYLSQYKAANPTTTLSDAEITELYEADKKANAAAELAEKLKKAQEAQEAYQKAQEQLRMNEEFLRDAKMSGEKVGRTTYDIETYEQAVAANKKALYGDPLATPPTKGAAADLADARAALGVPASGATTAIPADELPPDLAAQLAAYQLSAQAARDTDATDEATWELADNAKKAYDKEAEDAEFGDEAIKLKQAKVALAMAKTGTVILFSVLMGIISLAQMIYHRYMKAKKAQISFWASMKLSLTKSRLKFTARRKSPKTFVKHTITSEWTTEVSAENDLILQGEEEAKLHSKNTLVQGTEQVVISSPEKVEVAGAKELKLTSGAEIGLDSDKFKGVTKTELDLSSLKEAKLTAGTKMEIAAHDALDVDADEFKLKVVKKAELLAGGWSLKLDTKSAELGNDHWQLAFADAGVNLGAPGGGAELQITAAKTTLQSAGTLELSSTGGPMKISAATVNFGAAAIISDNLMVKGSMDPTIAALKIKIKAAQTKGEAAALAAATAETTAIEAKRAARQAKNVAYSAAHTANRALNDVNALADGLDDGLWTL
jgi:type VI secretion system secreted protein VgrG